MEQCSCCGSFNYKFKLVQDERGQFVEECEVCGAHDSKRTLDEDFEPEDAA